MKVLVADEERNPARQNSAESTAEVITRDGQGAVRVQGYFRSWDSDGWFSPSVEWP